MGCAPWGLRPRREADRSSAGADLRHLYRRSVASCNWWIFGWCLICAVVGPDQRRSVLPIEKCSRRLVPQLERANYDVTYREFDGPHTIPAAIAREAIEWYLTSG